MIKKVFHKIFSSTLALLVLFSTVSFTVEKHYCGDVLVDVSMFTSVEKCAMENMEVLLKMNCCKDEVNVVKGQDELKLSSIEDVKLAPLQFATLYVYTYLNLFKEVEKQPIPFNNYSPPNLVANIQALHQVFII
ncbi:HYC_CC_PP family protein [Neotamlana sedimentorum]|uniref:HYC_CC_PP family protein n=1 Tax=Neotamlana sedimentorum TaxID=1435349 RepID=UPI00069BAF94|nr:hypothetical protein [Tamlana sedimentorum]